MKSLAIRVALLLTALAAPAAFAEDGVPYREGNIWNGINHEPVPSTVERDEQAVGIAPSVGKQRQADDDVEQLYRQLLEAEKRHVQ